MYANLHLHSTFSDGTDTPAELCALARENRVAVISITDHDAVSGVNSLGDLGAVEGVRVIPGIEISCFEGRNPLHVLGYYIDTHNAALDAFIEGMSKDKTENTRIIFEHALAQGVFDYPWERVAEVSPGQKRLSGIHVIKAMEADGYRVPGMTLPEMFRRYFLPVGEGFIETPTASGYNAIDIIKAAGGIPVIAHPRSIGNDRRVIDLIEYGAQGLEVYHSAHSKEEMEKYLRLAIQYKCYVTGGSDWHGANNRPEVTSFAVTGLEHADYPILHARRA